MINGNKIQKWGSCLNWLKFKKGWQVRYYTVRGGMFYFSEKECFKLEHAKRYTFLGTCQLIEKENLLILSTGSKMWYFRGNNVEKEIFKNSILNGISNGKSNLGKIKYIIPELKEEDLKKNILSIKEEELSPKEENENFISLDQISLKSNDESMILDNSSITSVNADNLKKVLQKIEKKIQLKNLAFKGLLDTDEKKEEFEELYLEYCNIEKRLKKVNKYLNNQK